MKRIRMLTLGMGLLLAFIFSAVGFMEGNAWGLERNVIKVGVACALKRPYGVASLRGAEMAAKEINDAGGVLGAKIQLVSADTEGTAPKATEAIEKLFYTDKVDTIVGAYTSEEATAFQEQAAKLKLNIIFHGTTSILDKKFKADPEKYKYYWNYVPADFQYAEYARDHVLPLFVSALKKRLGLQKVNVAVVTDVALWTEVMHGIYLDGVKGNPDCELVYVGKVAREAVDFTAELTEMRKRNVQIIFVAWGYSAGYTFVKQAYDIRLPAMITGMNTLAWSVKDFLKAAGMEAAAYNSSLSVFSMPTTPHTVKLLKEYDRIYGGSPHMDVGATYNGLKAYAKAVEMAKSLNHDKVQQQLGKVRLPENAAWNCKEFRFDDTHRIHISQKDGMLFSTYQFDTEGKVVMLQPEEYKTGELMIPPWMEKAWKK